MRIVAVNWFCLLLAFAPLHTLHSIKVSVEPDVQNTTTTMYSPSSHHDANTTIGDDSDMSASERNRRLIPYVAFYLPPSQIPINQQYTLQRTKPPSVQPPPTAVESAGPLPPPMSHLPVPPTYLQVKLSPTGQPSQSSYEPSAGEVYHTLTHSGGNGQHSIAPPGYKHVSAKPTPVLHLLPPGPAGPLTTSYKHINPHKHKTVQYFPPTAPTTTTTQQYEEYQQQQQQRQQQVYRQQHINKQSNNNLTPFTPTNTLPGQFIPIIYTPVDSISNNNNNYNNHNNNNDNSKKINYNYDSPTLPDGSVANVEQSQYHQYNQQVHKQQQQQQQQQQQHRHHHNQQQQQFVTEYPPSMPSSAIEEATASYKQHQQQAHHQVGLVAIANVPTEERLQATHKNTGAIYHVINEPPTSLSYETPPPPISSSRQQPLLPVAKQHQHQYRPNAHSHFHPPKMENFFDDEQQQPNVDDMTPQEKYVMYLQQRARYNKQKQRERIKQHEQYIKTEQQKHRFNAPIHVVSTTATPVDGESSIEMEHHHQQQQQQQQQVHQPSQNAHYPQHSPIGHAVYPRPELPVPSNHQISTTKQVQQVLHIPVSALVKSLLLNQPARGTAKSKFASQQYTKSGSQHNPSTSPQYIDYIIEEPKQSLDEDGRQQQVHQQQQKKPPPPPQAGYIVITTSPTRYSTTSRPLQHLYTTVGPPIYKNPSTLRLQPVTHAGPAIKQFSTRRPIIVASSSTPAPHPLTKIFANTKQIYTSPSTVATPTPAIKLKPILNYEPNVKPTLPPPASSSIAPVLVEYVSSTTDISPTKSASSNQNEAHRFQLPDETTTATTKPTNNYHNNEQKQSAKQHTISVPDPNQLPDIRTSSLAEILHKLQASNHLPQTLTPENIDNSIKTLVTILNNLKQTQTIVANPPQHHEAPPAAAAGGDYDYNTGSEEDHGVQDLNALPPIAAPAPSSPSAVVPNKHPGPSTGRPGVDYPNYAEIPQTNFNCAEQRYKGFFGDPETNCQVWHYCDLNGGKASFLCPNGTIFSQIALTCDWWFNVKCSTTAQLYVLNERLYKYILPFTPKFPEDYSGPLVDKYLALKFQEMEDKMRLEKEKTKEKAAQQLEEAQQQAETDKIIEETTTVIPKKKHQSVNSVVGEQSSERNLLIDDEVDDISQRGTIDTYEKSIASSTMPTVTTTTVKNEEQELSLSLKPIVVSSTSEPDYGEINNSQERDALYGNDNTSNVNDTIRQQLQSSTSSVDDDVKRDEISSLNLSVEKVEVIEIKNDGTSGHLTPEMRLR